VKSGLVSDVQQTFVLKKSFQQFIVDISDIILVKSTKEKGANKTFY